MESCIRDKADIYQLKNCIQYLNDIQNEISETSTLLRLAGNEVRLKILVLLRMEESMCPCDLSDVLNMSVPAVSQHLKKLKDSDILRSSREGQTIFYSLNSEKSELLEPMINSVKKELA